MQNRQKKVSQNQQNPVTRDSQSPEKQCSFTKTHKLSKGSKPSFQNLKVSQSTIVLAQNMHASPCSKCKIYEQKFEKLRLIQREVSYMKQRNSEIKEEVELLLNNFMYILELASENIIRGAKSKVKKIMVTKQNLIQKQCQLIKRLQNQSEVLIDKVDAGLENSQKILEMQEKIKLLEAENRQLREAATRKQNMGEYAPSFNSSTDIYTLESGQASPKEFLNYNYQFGSSNPQNGFSSMLQSHNRIKKRRTLQIEGGDYPHEQSSHIKSIKSLKMKINIIKQKLINQKL